MIPSDNKGLPSGILVKPTKMFSGIEEGDYLISDGTPRRDYNSGDSFTIFTKEGRIRTTHYWLIPIKEYTIIGPITGNDPEDWL